MTTDTKRYSELILLSSFEERFNYLKLGGTVSEQTFGYSRWLNQVFYKSAEWKKVRQDIIMRDLGCDLGIPGREVRSRLIIHHLNPITEADILEKSYKLIDPENLIVTSKRTHDAIHYGDESSILKDPIHRSANDTTPWK